MYGKRHCCLMAIGLPLALLLAPGAHADEVERGKRLADAMALSQAFEDGKAVCMERMEAEDVEQAVADAPALLGGIRPDDADWPQAKALYITMLKNGCVVDDDAAEDAYARTLGESLSASDIDEMLAFYRTDLGLRFLKATLEANVASYRVAKPVLDSKVSYANFERDLAALLAQRPKPAERTRRLDTVQALGTSDEAIAISDKIMQRVSTGQVREGLHLGVPHAVLTQEQVDSIIKQFEDQKPVMADRFGKSVGYELLRNDTVGDSLIRVVFLNRFDKHAMVWLFVWYRGSDGWVLNNLSYVDNPSLLFR